MFLQMIYQNWENATITIIPQRQKMKSKFTRNCIEHLQRQKEIEIQIRHMLKYDIIEESTLTYASPVALVKTNRNNDYRFAIDNRNLNAVTPIPTFPATRLDDGFDGVRQSKAQRFSTLDLASGYWQIALDEKTKHKTAFSTHDNLYQFKRMPFGFINAPATFQMLMNMIVKGLTWKHCLVYIDDIIIWSDEFENHSKHLNLVSQRLRDANLTLKPLNGSSAKPEVTYLGHIISQNGIKVNLAKIETVESLPLPKCNMIFTVFWDSQFITENL